VVVVVVVVVVVSALARILVTHTLCRKHAVPALLLLVCMRRASPPVLPPEGLVTIVFDVMTPTLVST
jgi:hypothetical protein